MIMFEQLKMRRILKRSFWAVLLALGAFLVMPASASAASLYMSPSGLSKAVGSYFTASVLVNTAGASTNAYSGTVTFPPNIITATQVTRGGSICSLFTSDPQYSNSSGTATFSCGLPSPGYTGSSGKIIDISFKGVNPGTATVSISGGQVLANDGRGTNIITGTAGGTYTITNPPPPPPTATKAPAVTSPSHPDQNLWYAKKDVVINWGKVTGAIGYSYVFDTNAGTIPSSSVNTTTTGITLSAQAEGIRYFHIKASGTNGWSVTTHYRVQIDTVAPETLDIVSDIQGEGKTRPLISYSATDATSGVDHYELSMDGGAYKKVDYPSFRPDSITSGSHTFSVKAFDKAGNVKEKTITVRIKQIQTPVIEIPKSGSYFKIGQAVKISGTGEPGTLLILYIDGKIIADNIKISADGTWRYEYKGILLNGTHDITAKSMSDGIESQLSKKTKIIIDSSAVSLGGIIIPSFVFITSVGIIFLLLILLLLYLYRKIRKIRAAYKKRREETEDVIEKNLKILEADMEKKIEHELEAKHSRGSVWKTEKNVEKELKEEIEEAEERIKKELEKEDLGKKEK